MFFLSDCRREANSSRQPRQRRDDSDSFRGSEHPRGTRPSHWTSQTRSADGQNNKCTWVFWPTWSCSYIVSFSFQVAPAYFQTCGMMTHYSPSSLGGLNNLSSSGPLFFQSLSVSLNLRVCIFVANIHKLYMARTHAWPTVAKTNTPDQGLWIVATIHHVHVDM